MTVPPTYGEAAYPKTIWRGYLQREWK